MSTVCLQIYVQQTAEAAKHPAELTQASQHVSRLNSMQQCQKKDL